MLPILRIVLIASLVFTASVIPIRANEADDLEHNPHEFYEVDAYGDDFVDFGAFIGQNGAFTWHSDHPVVN